MEMMEWVRDTTTLDIVPGRVDFKGYPMYLDAAHRIADTIRSQTLTEDNVQEVKGMLASARRVVNALDAERIKIKKELLNEYTFFEQQIKDLTSVIDEADSELRGKVKELEEQERDVKKQTLREIWDKRIGMYTFPMLVENPFDKWLTPKMLNKSTTLKAAEQNMTTWMEMKEIDIETLRKLGDEYVEEYVLCGNIATVIDRVDERHRVQESVKKMNEDAPVEEAIPVAKFVIKGETEIRLVELLLKSNNIKYERN